MDAKTLKKKPLTADRILSVYEGAEGRCYCGCAGTHSYNSKFIKEASADRGYAVNKDEVDDGAIEEVLSVEVQDVCITAVVGRTAYTAYFTKSEMERQLTSDPVATLKKILTLQSASKGVRALARSALKEVE